MIPAKLAAHVGVTRQTINSMEKGRFHPNLRLAFKIARTFGKRIAKVLMPEMPFLVVLAARTKSRYVA
jgi:putative transcriptional regulator